MRLTRSFPAAIFTLSVQLLSLSVTPLLPFCAFLTLTIKLFGIKRITMFGIGKHLKKHIKKWVDVAPADDDDDSDNDGHAPPPKKSGAKRAAPSSASKPATKKKAVIKAKGSSGGDDEKKARKPGGFACTPYALSPIMARVTGETQLPRPQVVKKLWEYIKANELQNPSNKSEIHCDKLLAELFGQKMVTMFSMNKFIGQHLTKIET
jgi:upstream activation factor subunit UAF30